MRFNFRQIEVFRAIMVTGSVTRAAKLLNVSQPAISRLLSHTEQRLGLLLFQRIKGRLYPTPEAQRLLAEVEAVYEGVERVNGVADDLIHHRQGHLRIACSPSLGQGFIPGAVARFLRQHADARVSISTLNPSVMTQALVSKQVDLGVVLLADPHPNLESRLLHGNRLLIAVGAAHPLAARDTVALADVAAEEFIGYGPDVPIGALVRRLFFEAGVTMRPKIDAQQTHVACALVREGVGVAVVDEITAMGPIWAGVVTRPLDIVADAPVHIQLPVFEPLSRLGLSFIDTLEAMRMDWLSGSTRPSP